MLVCLVLSARALFAAAEVEGAGRAGSMLYVVVGWFAFLCVDGGVLSLLRGRTATTPAIRMPMPTNSSRMNNVETHGSDYRTSHTPTPSSSPRGSDTGGEGGGV